MRRGTPGQTHSPTSECEQLPTVKLPTVNLPTVKLPTVKLPTAKLPTVKLPTVELPTASAYRPEHARRSRLLFS